MIPVDVYDSRDHMPKEVERCPPPNVTYGHRAYIEQTFEGVQRVEHSSMNVSRAHPPPRHGPPAIFEYDVHGDLITDASAMSFPQRHGDPFYRVGDCVQLQSIRRSLLGATQNWRDLGRRADLGWWIIMALIVKDSDEVIVGYKIRAITPTANGEGTVHLARVAVVDGRTGRGRAQVLSDAPGGPAVWTRANIDENLTEFNSAGLVPIYRWVGEHAPDFFLAGMGTAATATEEIAQFGIRAALKKAIKAGSLAIAKSFLAAIKEYAKLVWPLVREEARVKQRLVDAAMVVKVAETNPEFRNEALDKFVETFIDETLGEWIGSGIDDAAKLQMRQTLANSTLFRPFANLVTTRVVQAAREAAFQTWVVGASRPDDFPDAFMNAWVNQATEEGRGIFVPP